MTCILFEQCTLIHPYVNVSKLINVYSSCSYAAVISCNASCLFLCSTAVFYKDRLNWSHSLISAFDVSALAFFSAPLMCVCVCVFYLSSRCWVTRGTRLGFSCPVAQGLFTRTIVSQSGFPSCSTHDHNNLLCVWKCVCLSPRQCAAGTQPLSVFPGISHVHFHANFRAENVLVANMTLWWFVWRLSRVKSFHLMQDLLSTGLRSSSSITK